MSEAVEWHASHSNRLDGLEYFDVLQDLIDQAGRFCHLNMLNGFSHASMPTSKVSVFLCGDEVHLHVHVSGKVRAIA